MNNIKTVFIVAGHGLSITGKIDNGAMSNGFTERKFTYELSSHLVGLLEGTGVQHHAIGVDKPLTLQDKIKEVNDICARDGLNVDNSLLISIHINAGGGTGIETYTYKDWIEGLGYGNRMLLNLNNQTGLKIRGAKYENASQYNQLGIVHDTTPIAVLIECGFIDNEEDLELLVNSQSNIAIGLYNGIAEIMGFEKITTDSSEIELLKAEILVLKTK